MVPGGEGVVGHYHLIGRVSTDFDFVGFERNFLTGLLDNYAHMGRHVGVTVCFGFQIITLEALEIEIRHCGAVDALLPSRRGSATAITRLCLGVIAHVGLLLRLIGTLQSE